MSSSVDLIKEKLDVSDLIGSYIKLEKSGINFKAKCPFHNEKSASFFVSVDRGTYYCFGCGAKGDIFTFVQEFEGVDFRGALKLLALRAGVSLEPENITARTQKDRFTSALSQATFFFQKKLQEHTPALEYLKNRGLTEKTIKEWQIGYAPLNWHELEQFLVEKEFQRNELHAVGLIKKSEKSQGEYYDVFRGRIMFPIFDSAGNVIAFSGRILVDDKISPKYLNTPETPLFNKSETLYGLHVAKIDIRRKDFSILVEGQMDLVMSHQTGFGNTVASSGTAFTAEHLKKLKRLSNRILMAFDADGAGFSAANKSAQLALSLGMEVKVALLPKGSDPAELIKTNLPAWKHILSTSLHIIDFYMKSLLLKNIEPRNLGKEIRSHVLPYIALLESSIERSHFISKIVRDTGIKEDALWEDLKMVAQKQDSTRPSHISQSARGPQELRSPAKKQSLEKKIFGIILWQTATTKKQLDPAVLRTRLGTVIGEKELDSIAESTLHETSGLIFETEAYYNNNEKLTDEVEDLFINLAAERLKEEFTVAMTALSAAEKLKDTEKVAEMLAHCQELSKKMSGLPKRI